MRVRELIEVLKEVDPDLTVHLEVGGDGAVHSTQTFHVHLSAWNKDLLVITSEQPAVKQVFGEDTGEYKKVHVEGRGLIDRVGTDDVGACGRCHSKNLQVENHSGMWHDGDIVCQDCGGYVRMFDAG